MRQYFLLLICFLLLFSQHNLVFVMHNINIYFLSWWVKLSTIQNSMTFFLRMSQWSVLVSFSGAFHHHITVSSPQIITSVRSQRGNNLLMINAWSVPEIGDKSLLSLKRRQFCLQVKCELRCKTKPKLGQKEKCFTFVTAINQTAGNCCVRALRSHTSTSFEINIPVFTTITIFFKRVAVTRERVCPLLFVYWENL